MNQRAKGVLCVMVSAFIFGFTPILGRITYDGGSNAVMLTFLRGIMALPVLFVMMKIRRIPMAITKRNAKDFLLMGTLGSALTTLTLYTSYNYIPVGMATVLHFVYPSCVVLFSTLFFRERMGKVNLAALLLSTAGVVAFCDISDSINPLGIVLALASAFCYAFVMIYQYRSTLISLHPLKTSFYLCCVTSVAMLIYGIITHKFTLALTPKAYGYSFLVSMFVAVCGLSLLQYGLGLVGSSTASILSMLEPITSVAAGMLVLGEKLTLLKVLGCVLILSGVAALTLSAKHATRKEPDTASQSTT